MHASLYPTSTPQPANAQTLSCRWSAQLRSKADPKWSSCTAREGKVRTKSSHLKKKKKKICYPGPIANESRESSQRIHRDELVMFRGARLHSPCVQPAGSLCPSRPSGSVSLLLAARCAAETQVSSDVCPRPRSHGPCRLVAPGPVLPRSTSLSRPRVPAAAASLGPWWAPHLSAVTGGVRLAGMGSGVLGSCQVGFGAAGPCLAPGGWAGALCGMGSGPLRGRRAEMGWDGYFKRRGTQHRVCHTLEVQPMSPHFFNLITEVLGNHSPPCLSSQVPAARRPAGSADGFGQTATVNCNYLQPTLEPFLSPSALLGSRWFSLSPREAAAMRFLSHVACAQGPWAKSTRGAV